MCHKQIKNYLEKNVLKTFPHFLDLSRLTSYPIALINVPFTLFLFTDIQTDIWKHNYSQ